MQKRYMPTRELLDYISRSPFRNVSVPMECTLSWPVPVEAADSIYLRMFFYLKAKTGEGEYVVRRPAFELVVNPVHGEVVSFVNCLFNDFAAGVPGGPVVGSLSYEALPAKTLEELQQLREVVGSLYDRLLAFVFEPPRSVTPEDRTTVIEFVRWFDRVVEPCLRPFYEALNPSFFRWLSDLTSVQP